jgi:hypothetical protein
LAKFIILSKLDLSKFMDYCNLYWYYCVFLQYLSEYLAEWFGLMFILFILSGNISYQLHSRQQNPF